MAALIDAAKLADFPAEIVSVISNRADAGGLEKAAASGIPTTVIESKPPRRLVITWAEPKDRACKEKHSRVTFEIEPIADMVRLSVTHAELEPGSEMFAGISDGWPRVLCSLKSLIETGRPLKTWAGH